MRGYSISVLWFGLWTLISTFAAQVIPPRIKLVNYIEADKHSQLKAESEFQTDHEFENEFLSKNGSDFILRPGLYSATFECKAEYPVVWTIPFPEQITTQTKRSREFTEYRSSIPSVDKPHNQAFYTWLHFYNQGQNSISANFTCLPSANPETETSSKQSSIHIFSGGSNAIDRQGETLEISVSPKSEQFVIPCRPALPNIPIILEKQVKNSSSYKEVPHSSYLSFDSKIGFKMNKSSLGKNMFGMYRCKVKKTDYASEINARDKEDFVYVHFNVTKVDSEEVDNYKDFKIYKSISGNAKAEYSDDNYVCCSGVRGINPQVFSKSCYTAGECYVAKKQFVERIRETNRFDWDMKSSTEEKNDCSSAYIGHTSSNLIYCKGRNLEVVENYMPALHPNLHNVESRLNETIESDLTLFNYGNANAILSQPVESKAFIFVGSLEYGIRPNTQGIYLFQDHLLKELSTNDLQVISENTRIQEFDRNHYYEGENLTFTCLALTFFYTSGIQTQLKWRNGTVTNFVQPTLEETIQVFLNGFLPRIRYDMDIYHFFNEPIPAHLEMESVNCYIPKWNSSDWDVLKYNLDIRTPVLPKVEAEKENVYFELMESDAQIQFNIHGGKPPPKMISIFKDDKLIANSSSMTRNFEENPELPEKTFDHDGVVGGESSILDIAFIMNVTMEESNGSNSDNDSFIIKIKFFNVTQDIQGIYRCVAENVKGNVTKDIHVFLSAKPSKARNIIISLTIILGILLLGIGVWYRVKYKTIQVPRYSNRRLN